MGTPRGQLVDPIGSDIEPYAAEAGAGRSQQEWEPHVSQTQDSRCPAVL
jgi:hypothetical protein